MRLPALLLTALCLALCSAPAGAELWRWVDADGVVRYTPNPERVPGQQRSSMARVEPGMPAVAPMAVAPMAATPAEPAPLYVPADEFSFAADPFNAPNRAQTLRGSDVPEPLEPSATAPLGAERASTATSVPPTLPTATPKTAPSIPNPPPLDAAQREHRDALAAQIERDENTLKALISSGQARAGEPSDELREIAKRLPQLQAEMRELEGGTTSGSEAQRP